MRSEWWKSSAQVGVAVVAAAAPRAHDHRIVEPGLGDHVRPRVDRVHAPGDLGDDVLGAGVEDRVDGVEPQPVDPEVAHPALGALAHPLPDRAALGVVVVHGLAPRRLVLGGEVRPEGLESLCTGGAEVVVDHVEDHRQPFAVRGRHQLGEPGRSAVRGLGGRDVDAVVTPSPSAGELGHGHDLDRGHAEPRQFAQVRGGGREGPFLGEGADVQLVDDGIPQLGRGEPVTAARQRASVEHPRGRLAGPAAASGCRGRAPPSR